MFNRGLRISLMFILYMTFLGCFTAPANGEKNMYDVLSGKGFNEKSQFLVCTINDNKTVKNINQDFPILLDKIKKVSVTKGVPEPAKYVIWLANGSSLESQAIIISVAETGNGYIQYMKNNIAYFKSIDLYEFCVTAFNDSKIIVGPVRQPQPEF